MLRRVAVLQGLAVKNPRDMPVLAAYGKALADAGRLQEAASVLERAHTPDRPSWSVLSAQGSVADQMGDHAGAQSYYSAALKINPNEPDVLSNLGLSYALERKMPQAEDSLRLAVAQPSADARIRQNLALVLSLEGKDADAEAVSRRDFSPIDAAENVAQLKQTIAGSPTWAPVKGATQAKTRVANRSTPADRAEARAHRLQRDGPIDRARRGAVTVAVWCRPKPSFSPYASARTRSSNVSAPCCPAASRPISSRLHLSRQRGRGCLTSR